MNMKVAAACSVLAILLCGLLAACGVAPNRSGDESDGPVYASVSALAEQSDTVLVIELGDLATREMDDGGDDTDDDASVAMAFWDATVVVALAEEFGEDAGDHVVLAWPDLDEDNAQNRSGLKTGQILVIFAKRLTPIDAPGIETQDVFYVPVGGDNGVFDVDGEQAVARSDALSRVLASDEPTEGLLTVGLDELARTVTVPQGSTG